jgi:hypothetical protein
MKSSSLCSNTSKEISSMWKRYISPALAITVLLAIATCYSLARMLGCSSGNTCISGDGFIAFPNSIAYFFPDLDISGRGAVIGLLFLNAIFLSGLWALRLARAPSISKSTATILIYVVISIAVSFGIIFVKMSP